jgi:hypothetical protein
VALGPSAWAENDPYKIRVRGRTDVPYPSFQGDRCTTIDAARDVVWSLLVTPEHVTEWLLVGLDVVPISARYKKGSGGTKGDVLAISADTKEGPRTLELTTLVAVENQLLAVMVTKDDEILAAGVTNLIYTLVLEDAGHGRTDLYWATHYDADSPLSALSSPLKGSRRHKNRAEPGLLVLWGLGEAAGGHAVESRESAEAAARAQAARPRAPTPRPTPRKRPKRSGDT